VGILRTAGIAVNTENEIAVFHPSKSNIQRGRVKSPFISSPIGAILGYFGAKAVGWTGFWETMAMVVVGMVLAWVAMKKVGEKFD
jgi:ABC-type phosphate/phosphonate transport system permease subunit